MRTGTSWRITVTLSSIGMKIKQKIFFWVIFTIVLSTLITGYFIYINAFYVRQSFAELNSRKFLKFLHSQIGNERNLCFSNFRYSYNDQIKFLEEKPDYLLLQVQLQSIFASNEIFLVMISFEQDKVTACQYLILKQYCSNGDTVLVVPLNSTLEEMFVNGSNSFIAEILQQVQPLMLGGKDIL